jgi:cysteate synthase
MVSHLALPKAHVVCTKCGEVLAPLAHSCPRCPDALPRTTYAETRFLVADRDDIFRFASWLPGAATIATTIAPVVFHSERIAARLGMDDLVVAFSGYAPAVGARNMTGSFKDFEALPTLLYLRELGVAGVILASAGNTARAFAYAATVLEFPTVIVVPEAAAGGVRIPIKPSEAVRLIAVADSADYSAAIRLASAIAEARGLYSEGGARNVARRDGMGTVLLEYARVEGRLPRHYVQAVGSGTGAIATWEAAMRLQASGMFPDPLPCLHIAQNAPFVPIHNAWTTHAEIDPEKDVERQLEQIRHVSALVLANRTPPFALEGGVRSALSATSGRTYAVTNGEIAAAQRLFEAEAGLSVGPESGAALAALSQARARDWIRRDEPVLLHATGSGDALLQRDHVLHVVPVWQRVPPELASVLSAFDRAAPR